jgi:AraC family transcriptional activator FtrA
MNKRTFIRRYTQATRLGPGQWLANERLNRAKELLETGEITIDQVAERSGFGSAAVLRHHFRKRLGLTPSAYRRAHLR